MFSNYIFDKIFTLIINHIYINNYSNKNYKSQYNQNNNEIIQYSLVSKRIFQIISKSLTAELNFKNYKSLYHFINNNNSNNNLKLIKNSLIKYYESYLTFSLDKVNHKNFKKILVEINNSDLNLLNDTNLDLSNCRFNVSSYSLLVEVINKYNGIGGLRFNKLSIRSEQGIQDENMFNELLKFKPKYLSLDFPSEFQKIISYTNLFSNNFIKSIKVGESNYLEPLEVSSINNQFTKLSTISAPFLFHKLIRLFNNGGDGQDLDGDCENNIGRSQGLMYEPNLVMQHWELMIKTLSNNTTIKKFSIKDFCATYCDTIVGLDPSKIVNDLIKILNGPNSSIETLVIENSDFLFYNSTFLEALESNTSIRNLELINVEPPLFFTKVLISNKTIKNLSVKFYQDSFFMNTLSDNINSLNLYSISIIYASYFHRGQSFQNIINSFRSLLSLQTSTTIKEFNIFRKHNYDYPRNKNNINNLNNNNFKQIINNNINTIFSVSYFSFKIK